MTDEAERRWRIAGHIYQDWQDHELQPMIDRMFPSLRIAKTPEERQAAKREQVQKFAELVDLVEAQLKLVDQHKAL